MKKILLVFSLAAFTIIGVNAQTPWYLTGNLGTDPSSNFIGTTDNNPLIFKTAGNERMKLLSDKPFLGIGVSTPQATLHLHYQGGAYPPTLQKLLQLTTNATGNGDGNGFSIFSDKNTKDILFKQNEHAKFFIKGPGGGFVIAPNGRIGIGTDDPKAMLHVTLGILTQGNLTVNNKITLTPHYELDASFWDIEDNSDGLNFSYTDYTTFSDTTLYKGGSNPVAFSRLFISKNGCVGIGSTRPANKLEVNGSAVIAYTLMARALSAQSAEIENTLTTKILNAQSADISSVLTANELNAQNATISRELNASTANITNTLTANTLTASTLKATNANISGKVNIGTSSSNINLDVKGTIRSEEVRVCVNQGCDYVFEDNYELMNLSDLHSFIKTNKHLPDVAPAAEMEAEGINLSEMNALLLKKVEELTLYILQQNEKMTVMQEQINELKKQ